MNARGSVDFSPLLWLGIVLGLLLGGCGYCAAGFVFRHLHIGWSEAAE